MVIWGFGPCLGIDAQWSDVPPGFDKGLESSEVYVPRLVKATIVLFPHASAYFILIIFAAWP